MLFCPKLVIEMPVLKMILDKIKPLYMYMFLFEFHVIRNVTNYVSELQYFQYFDFLNQSTENASRRGQIREN